MATNGTSEKNKIEEFTAEDEIELTSTQKSCGQTCRDMFRNVTVEPIMILFVTGCLINMLTTQNLSLEKACRVNLNFTFEICSSLKLQEMEAENEYEKATQKLLAKFISSRTYITATIPCILALFAGSYSDKTGRRKLFILIPITGQSLICISNAINVYFFYQLNLEFLTFSEAILEGFSGGWCLCFFILFSYVSAITNEKTRTFRLGLCSFAMTVGFPIGMGASGIIIKKLGYYGGYGIAFGIHMVNLMYTGFVLKDAKRSPEEKQHDNKGALYVCRMFFSFKSIIECIRVVFRAAPNNRRIRLIVYMIVVAILFGPLYGEISVLYLTTRYRFNWDEVQFSVFQTYNFLAHTVGTLFSITVFSKMLGWHDSVLGIISCTSKIAAAFIYCFAPNGKIFFIAPVIDFLNGTSMLAMRSQISKLVDPNELGKANSLISLAENLMPLGFVPLYTNVYRATMDVLPGAVFLLGASLTLPSLIAFLWMLGEHIRNKRKAKIEEIADLPNAKSTLLTPN